MTHQAKPKKKLLEYCFLTALSFGLLIGLELIGTRRETGAAWGTVIQSRSGYLLKMILLMLLLLKKGYILGLWGKIAAAFVIGGALGNGIDRVLRGYVVDMFEVRFIRFAIFNVADIFITVGGVMLVIYFLFLEGKTLGGKE